MARRKNGTESKSPVMRRVRMPWLYAFSASSDLVEASSILRVVALHRRQRLAELFAELRHRGAQLRSTLSFDAACVCSSASTLPSTQSCAFSVITYDEPSMAMVPPSSAFAPARWHTSLPTSAVIGVIGSRPISRSVACTC